MRLLCVFVATLVVGISATESVAREFLTPVAAIPLPGVEGRIDHMALDTSGNRLYIAALGNNSIEVLDLVAGKRIQSIKGPREPQGIAVDPESHGIVVASGGDGMCRVYDASLKLTGSLGDLDDADNVRYDAKAKRAYVGYGSGALAIIDPKGPAKLSETKLPGHPESFQLEKDGNRIFVNVPSARQVAVLSKTDSAILTQWPVTTAESNFPMALDEPHHRLFVGCRKPAKLLVFDTESGKVVTSLECCGDTDDVFYNTSRKLIYVSGGEGCVTILSQGDADHYEVVGKVLTAPGARTSYFDPAAGRLYVAVPHRGAQTAEIRIYQAQP